MLTINFPNNFIIFLTGVAVFMYGNKFAHLTLQHSSERFVLERVEQVQCYAYHSYVYEHLRNKLLNLYEDRVENFIV